MTRRPIRVTLDTQVSLPAATGRKYLIRKSMATTEPPASTRDLNLVAREHRVGDAGVDQRGRDSAVQDAGRLREVRAVPDGQDGSSRLHLDDLEPDEPKEGQRGRARAECVEVVRRSIHCCRLSTVCASKERPIAMQQALYVSRTDAPYGAGTGRGPDGRQL